MPTVPPSEDRFYTVEREAPCGCKWYADGTNYKCLTHAVVDATRDCGVSPCLVNCGEPACQKLGCVRVYNARHRAD